MAQWFLAKGVSENTAKHHLRSVPRILQAQICKELNLTITEEDDDFLKGVQMTKENVVNELKTMIQELKQLKKQAEESSQFLTELEEWGGAQKDPQTHCGYCRKSLHGCNGICFPCGHAFHEKCATKATQEAIINTESEKLLKKALSQGDKEMVDKIVCQDCPLCGMRAAGMLFSSFVRNTDEDEWNLEISPDSSKQNSGLGSAFGKFSSTLSKF